MFINQVEFICYIQPVVAVCEEVNIGWVDTNETKVVRRVVDNKAEALKVIEEARLIAKDSGVKCGIKKTSVAPIGVKRHNGVAKLHGSEIV